jgi:hypothetical protein
MAHHQMRPGSALSGSHRMQPVVVREEAIKPDEMEMLLTNTTN